MGRVPGGSSAATPVAVADGGTGATDAATARTNLGTAAEKYDQVVSSGGNIPAAITAAGANGKIFVERATYTVTADVAPLAGQRIYWDDVEIDFEDTGYKMSVATAGVKFEGKLKLTGETATLFTTTAAASGFDGKDCPVTLNPDAADYTGGSAQFANVGGTDGLFNLVMDAVAVSTSNNSAIWGIDVTGDRNKLWVAINGYTVTSASGDASGFRYLSGAANNVAIVNIDAVTTSGSGSAWGIRCRSGSSKNVTMGVSLNSGSNYTEDGGTNCNEAALIYS